jgi:hypothetical protein
MKKDSGMVPFALTMAALVVGALWTIVAGTLWQWLPIGAAILVVYGAARAYENGNNASKLNKKSPKTKNEKCC